MKRIRCPKCENYLTFDETKYTEGQSLVFVCDQCKKQFSIRLGKSKMKAPQKEDVRMKRSLKRLLAASRSLRTCLVLSRYFHCKKVTIS